MTFSLKNTQLFLAAAQKRPELAGVMTTALFGVPQVDVAVDTSKVMTQQISLDSVLPDATDLYGRNAGELLQSLWPAVAGLLASRRKLSNLCGKSRQVLCDQQLGQLVPLSTLTTVNAGSGPEFVMQYNLFQSVQIIGSAAPGYSSAQAIAALQDVFQENDAQPDGLRLHGNVVPGG